jgi:hypothetical protein
MRVFSAIVLMLTMAAPAVAEPGWSGSVIAFGTERERLQATPIEQRPYRPFHFYGNAVRRNYYRGTVLPAPRDLFEGATSLIPGQ